MSLTFLLIELSVVRGTVPIRATGSLDNICRVSYIVCQRDGSLDNICRFFYIVCQENRPPDSLYFFVICARVKTLNKYKELIIITGRT
jgi:hypothetical protein